MLKLVFHTVPIAMQTFYQWLSLHTPDQLIVQAVAESPSGLTRRELRERFPSLSYETFLQLLDAFVSFGFLSAAEEGNRSQVSCENDDHGVISDHIMFYFTAGSIWAIMSLLVNSPDETAVTLLNEATPDKEMTPKGVTHAAAGV